jgi:hypothetical protein
MYVLIMINFLNQLVKIRQKFIDCTFTPDFFSFFLLIISADESCDAEENRG